MAAIAVAPSAATDPLTCGPTRCSTKRPESPLGPRHPANGAATSTRNKSDIQLSQVNFRGRPIVDTDLRRNGAFRGEAIT